ncbi:myb domain-containing protein [Tieghemostelium lacteum]|uniref:Myb domain-containing protein n=1 Tax=Tieghemostelium lacteum TaxID=361077 RepID=A0A151Z851_TIELA|nr:myb domain-containing protein [Tieghemostelium lacteum]|eukprot:KYQ90130.1 myb domain-containing protein [Tieghemostelium lacteum]
MNKQRKSRNKLGLWDSEEQLVEANSSRKKTSVMTLNGEQVKTTTQSGRRITQINPISTTDDSSDDISDSDSDGEIKIKPAISNTKSPPPPPLPTPMTVKKKRGRPPRSTTTTTPTTSNINNGTNLPPPPQPQIAKHKKQAAKKVVIEESESDSEHFTSEEEDEVNSEDEQKNDSMDIEDHYKQEFDFDIEDFKMKSNLEKITVEYSIEKILDKRVVKNQETGENTEEYLIKWKDLAYIHSSWLNKELLNKTKSSRMRLKRFITKEEQNGYSSMGDDMLDDDDYENQITYHDHYEVDRVLDERVIPNSKQLANMEYLVKWKHLGYEYSSWEKKEDINDDLALERYKRYNIYPSPEELVEKPRPLPTDFQAFKETPAYFKNGNQLRPYQLEGLNWLNYSYHEQRNTILGDEMGLGKTVQSVSILETLRKQQHIRGPFLCIAPLTTIPHWKREFENWTDMNVLVYHDTGGGRPLIRNYEFYYIDPKKGTFVNQNVTKFNVLITTYEMALSDRHYLSKIKWRYLVIDEAHRLKNQACKLTNQLKTYSFDHLLLLTGTPLQNNIQELWALLNFADAKVFNSLSDFMQDYGNLQDAEQVTKLQLILKPYLLRRMKENVEKSIAPKEETIVEVELTTIQKKYYRAIYEKNFTFLKKGCRGQGPSLLNIMMELRKCCNHPYLIKGVEQSETQSLKGDEVYQKLIQTSGKLVLIDKLLPKLRAGNHKVLIFSQMVGVLNILDDYLSYRGYPHERIDGAIKASERQAAIDRFSRPDSDRFVFLLCTRAGGIGINLTAADTVIIFDSDWNPQNDLQAQARCHRIGQDKMVKVYRLVTRNTYERLMFDKASKKLGLDRAVLTMNSLASSKEDVPNRESINALLKYGAYAIKDDDASEKFYEEDIDKILDRYSNVIKHETLDPMANTFSTASFCSSTAAAHIDVNDPNFWEKFKPELESKVDSPLKPRSRKGVQRFGRFVDEFDDQDDEDEQDDDEEDYEDTNGAQSVQQSIKPLYKGWTPSERTRFKAILLMFGSGRWDLMRYLAEINKWNFDQCRQFGIAMISKIINEYRKENSNTDLTLEYFDSLVPSLEPMVLKFYIENDQKQQQQQQQSQLIQGVEMPDLSSARDHLKYDDNQNIIIHLNSVESNQSEINEEFNVFFKDASITDSYFNEYLKKNVKEVVRKLNNLALLAQLLRIGYSNMVDQVGEISDSPFPWWKTEQDNDLLVGIYKHGSGNYDAIRNDPSLSFCSHKWKVSRDDENNNTNVEKVEFDVKSDQPQEQEQQQQQPMETDTVKTEPPTDEYLIWPSSKLLSHRVKRLLKQLDLFKKQQEKGTKIEKKQQEKSKIEEKKKKRQEEWTKKEKSDFYKFLLIYGVYEKSPGEYSWDLLKEKASLKKKSTELIERYYFELLTKCNFACENQSTTIPDEDISIIQCRKLVNRIFFFSRIRQYLLPNENIENILSRLPPAGLFPQWWKLGTHDLALLQGTSKYGYMQLEEMVSDPSLPFYDIAIQIEAIRNGTFENQQMPDINANDKKRKFSEPILDILQFPKEKLLIKRLEIIISYACNIISNNSQNGNGLANSNNNLLMSSSNSISSSSNSVNINSSTNSTVTNNINNTSINKTSINSLINSDNNTPSILNNSNNSISNGSNGTSNFVGMKMNQNNNNNQMFQFVNNQSNNRGNNYKKSQQNSKSDNHTINGKPIKFYQSPMKPQPQQMPLHIQPQTQAQTQAQASKKNYGIVPILWKCY